MFIWWCWIGQIIFDHWCSSMFRSSWSILFFYLYQCVWRFDICLWSVHVCRCYQFVLYSRCSQYPKRDVVFFTLRQHKLLARLCRKVLCTILTINNTVIERGVNFKFLGPLWTWQITVTWIFFKNVLFIIYLYVFIYYIFLPYHLSYSFSTMIQCVTNLRGIANY